MPRPTRTDLDLLLQEARAIELLAEETEVEPDRLQDYWTVSADLVLLVADIESAQQAGSSGASDKQLEAMRYKLRQIAAELVSLSAD